MSLEGPETTSTTAGSTAAAAGVLIPVLILLALAAAALAPAEAADSEPTVTSPALTPLAPITMMLPLEYSAVRGSGNPPLLLLVVFPTLPSPCQPGGRIDMLLCCGSDENCPKSEFTTLLPPMSSA